MRHLLLAKELWKYVDGSEVLAEDANDEARATFRQKSQKALSTTSDTLRASILAQR